MNSPVICYLVGAGPGDIDLLTLRAKELLETANSVIYDHLIPEEALDLTPVNDCRCIDAGKVKTQTTKTQAEINKIIVKEYERLRKTPLKKSEAHKIIRLKGGDPFIFARATEELSVLKQHQIPYEIVPGISSFYAVPAYAGIPLTLREVSRSFSVITGHLTNEEENKNQSIISHSDTVVYLMGIKNLNKIITTNLKAGKDPNTPVALIQNGTLGCQKTVVTTIEKAITARDQEGISHPGIVIIGEVVKSHLEYNWFEQKPLFNQKIGVLRAKNELPNLVQPLKNLGAEVIPIPLMTCVPLESSYSKLINELKSKPRHILFTSAYAVKITMNAIQEAGYDSRLISRHQIITVGEGTNTVLNQYYLKADLIPQEASQNGVLQLIKELLIQDKIKDLIFPRALVIRKYLEQQLSQTSLKLTSIILYENRAVENTPINQIKNLDYLLFTSSRVVEFLLRHPEASNISRWPTSIAIGKVTYKTLSARFDKFTTLKSKSVIADEPSFKGLVKKTTDLVDKYKTTKTS